MPEAPNGAIVIIRGCPFFFIGRYNNLGGFTPVIDPETGRITGYKTERGADTIFPFSSVIFKPGSGPWDFSAEFPGGVGFDLKNCFVVANGWTSKALRNPNVPATNVFCHLVQNVFAFSGTYDNVTFTQTYKVNPDEQATGWYADPATDAGVKIKGCVYIQPEN